MLVLNLYLLEQPDSMLYLVNKVYTEDRRKVMKAQKTPVIKL